MFGRRSTSRAGPLRWSGRTAALLPAGAVLAADPRGWSPFGPAKWLTISVLVLTTFTLVTLAGRWRLVRRPTMAWLGLSGWLVVATVVAIDPLSAWIGTPERRFGLITWLLCLVAFVSGQAVSAAGGQRSIARGAVVAAAGMGLYAGVEALGWRPIAIDVGHSRLTGPFGSAAFLGAAIVLLGPVAAAMAWDRAESRTWRAVGAVSASALALELVGTGARAAMVGLAVALVLLAGTRWRWLRGHGRRVAAGASVMAVVAVVILAVNPLRHSVSGAFQRRSGGGSSRIDEWRVASRVILAHPLTGVGPEGYRIAFGEEVDAAYERAHGRTVLPDRAHNGLLDVAAIAGVPGLLLFGALLALVGAHVRRALRSASLVGVAVGLSAYAVGQQFLFPLAELEPVAWLLAGLVVAATARPSELIEASTPGAAAVLVAALAVAAVPVGVLELSADRDARTALRAAAAGSPQTALRAAQAAAGRRPDEVNYRLVAAQAAASRGTPDALRTAIDWADRALRLSKRDPAALDERADLVLQLALVTTDGTDITRARQAWQQIIDHDPVNANAWLQLGVAEALGADDGAAEAAWIKAEDLAPHSAAPSVNLARLYLRTGRAAQARVEAGRAVARQPQDPDARAALAQVSSG